MSRLLRRPGIVVAALIVLALAALVAINLVDQELSPEARALFAPPAPTFTRDSGWALLFGFNAPVDQDPRAYAEQLREAGAKRAWGAKRGVRAPEISVRAPSELVCSPESMDCIRVFAQRPESVAELAADNTVLLARYDELLRSTRLEDVTQAIDYYEEIGYFNVMMRTQLVRMSEVGAAAATGKVDRAIAWLEADAAFNRLWLEEAGSILTKMLAVRGYSRGLLVAGQLARNAASLSPAQWEALERIAAPLSPSQRGVARVVRSEATLFAGVLDHMLSDPKTTAQLIDAPRLMGSIAALTMRRNATLNFAYPLFIGWTRLDAVPTEALAPAIEETRARIRHATQVDWTWAYNLPGKGIAAEQAPDLAEYIYRVRDVDALAATIRCVIALRRGGVAMEAAAAFVAASPACRDPYGGPLGWKAESGELSFRARSPGQAKRFGGAGDRVVFAAYPR
jgi:hypothetical protein